MLLAGWHCDGMSSRRKTWKFMTEAKLEKKNGLISGPSFISGDTWMILPQSVSFPQSKLEKWHSFVYEGKKSFAIFFLVFALSLLFISKIIPNSETCKLSSNENRLEMGRFSKLSLIYRMFNQEYGRFDDGTGKQWICISLISIIYFLLKKFGNGKF